MKSISTKLKVILPCFVTFSTTILSLSSCASNKDKLPIDNLVEYDKEYGYDQAKYKRLVHNFTIEYEGKISQADSIHKQSPAFINKSMALFNNEIAHLEESFNSRQKQDSIQLSWTSKCDALLSYANNTYKIILSNVTESWDSTLNSIFTSYEDNLKIYMYNLKLSEDDQKKQIKNFRDICENIKDNARMRYGTVIESLPYIKNCLNSAIISINDDCSYLVTVEKLKEFLDNTKIEPISTPKDGYYWNQLKQNPRFDYSKYNDIDISEYIQYIFVFRKKIVSDATPINSNSSTINEKSFGKAIIPTADQLDGNIIPGYKLTPILKNMTANPETNTYTISIDWELINKNDIQKTNRDSLTAHSSVITDEKFSTEKDLVEKSEKTGTSKDYSTIVENYNNAPDDKKQFSDYVLPVTHEYEIKMLKATYLDDSAKNKISFGFDTDENLAYDTYLLLYGSYQDNQKGSKIVESEDGKSKIYTFLLSANDLGDIGVTINDNRLDSLLKDEKLKEEQNQEDYNYSNIDNIDVSKYTDDSKNNVPNVPTSLRNDLESNAISAAEQIFLTNCDIWAKVELDPNNENRFVKNFIYFAYKNTTISHDEIENKYFCGTNSIILEKNNMPISKKLFEIAQSYYNKASEVSNFYNTMALSTLRWSFLIQAGMYAITLTLSYFSASKLSAKFLATSWGPGVILSILYFALLIVLTGYLWITIPVGVYLYLVLACIASMSQTIIALNTITEKSNFYQTLKDDEKKLIFFMKDEFDALTLDQMYKKINYYGKIDSNEEYQEYIKPYVDEGVDPTAMMENFTSFISPLTTVQTIMGYWTTAQGIITIPLMVDPDTHQVHIVSSLTAAIWSFVKGTIYSMIFGLLLRLAPMFIIKLFTPSLEDNIPKADQ